MTSELGLIFKLLEVTCSSFQIEELSSIDWGR